MLLLICPYPLMLVATTPINNPIIYPNEVDHSYPVSFTQLPGNPVKKAVHFTSNSTILSAPKERTFDGKGCTEGWRVWRKSNSIAWPVYQG